MRKSNYIIFALFAFVLFIPKYEALNKCEYKDSQGNNYLTIQVGKNSTGGVYFSGIKSYGFSSSDKSLSKGKCPISVIVMQDSTVCAPNYIDSKNECHNSSKNGSKFNLVNSKNSDMNVLIDGVSTNIVAKLANNRTYVSLKQLCSVIGCKYGYKKVNGKNDKSNKQNSIVTIISPLKYEGIDSKVFFELEYKLGADYYTSFVNIETNNNKVNRFKLKDIPGEASALLEGDSSSIPYLDETIDNDIDLNVPIRFIANGLGYKVEWNGSDNNNIYITRSLPNYYHILTMESEFKINNVIQGEKYTPTNVKKGSCLNAVAVDKKGKFLNYSTAISFSNVDTEDRKDKNFELKSNLNNNKTTKDNYTGINDSICSNSISPSSTEIITISVNEYFPYLQVHKIVSSDGVNIKGSVENVDSNNNKVSFSKIKGATKYKVFRNSDLIDEGIPKLVKEFNDVDFKNSEITYIDTGLMQATEYKYFISSDIPNSGSDSLFVTTKPYELPSINYLKVNPRTLIFVNNPEYINPGELADEDNKLIYSTKMNGKSRIFYEHGFHYLLNDKYPDQKFYYLFKITNNNNVKKTFNIERGGMSISSNDDLRYMDTLNAFYGGNLNQVNLDKKYILNPKETFYFLHTDKGYVVSSDIKKLNTNFKGFVPGVNAFDGILDVNTDGELNIDFLAFKDINKIEDAKYHGNSLEPDYSNPENKNICSGDCSVFSGISKDFGDLTNNIEFKIDDKTENGLQKISFMTAFGNSLSERKTWTTNSITQSKWDYQMYIKDIFSLKVPYKLKNGKLVEKTFDYGTTLDSISENLYSPFTDNKLIMKYNVANWGAQYNENITIVNNGNKSKKVSFRIALGNMGYNLKQQNGKSCRNEDDKDNPETYVPDKGSVQSALYINVNSSDKLLVDKYNNGAKYFTDKGVDFSRSCEEINGYNRINVWTAMIPPHTKLTIPTIITLGSMSNGLFNKYIFVED